MENKLKLQILLLLLLLPSVLLVGCTTFNKDSGCSPQIEKLGSAEFSVEITSFKPLFIVQKSLLIIPPTGGTNAIDISYGKNFCKAGYNVSVLNDWTSKEEKVIDLELHQRFYTNAQKAVSLVLAETKTPFIGMLGTSVGALHAAISANTIPQLDAVYLIVGGANIAEVIVGSDQQAMIDLKAERKKKFGFKSDAEIIQAIDHAFKLEPLLQGSLYKNKDIGMVIAEHDLTVPTEYQIKLRDFYQPKAVLLLPNNHFWVIIKTWLFHENEILEFFEDSFKKREKKLI